MALDPREFGFLVQWLAELPAKTLAYVLRVREMRKENPEGFDHMLTMDPAFDEELRDDEENR